MNNKRTKILLAVPAVLVVLVVVWYFTKADGYITVTVTDIYGEVLAEKKIGYKTGDKLMDLVKDNFRNVTYQDSESGPIILTIESLTTLEDDSTHHAPGTRLIRIEYNGEFSDKGISQIEFKDGDKIEFREGQVTIFD